MKQLESAAKLVKTTEIAPAIRSLQVLFAELIEHLGEAPLEQRAQRLRDWDNYQRLSLGRGQTPALFVEDIKSAFSLAETPFGPGGHTGPSRALALPDATAVPAFAELDSVVRLAAQLAIPDGFERDKLIVTLFLYRVLVRPGQNYEGFIHRDIAAPDASVGSVVFYPTVTWQNIDGAHLSVYPSDRPTDELTRREPDVTYAPADYEHAALVLSYPHNPAHGVQPGTNRQPPRERTPAHDVEEFFDPGETTFLKDMAVVTFSETSAIED